MDKLKEWAQAATIIGAVVAVGWIQSDAVDALREDLRNLRNGMERLAEKEDVEKLTREVAALTKTVHDVDKRVVAIEARSNLPVLAGWSQLQALIDAQNAEADELVEAAE